MRLVIEVGSGYRERTLNNLNVKGEAMSKHGFKEWVVWQKAKSLAVAVYKL
jgi:hypothetical protein